MGKQTEKQSAVRLHFRAHPEDGQWVSECLELGVASCGDTFEEAARNILEATDLTLQTLDDEGMLASVLHERGLEVIPLTMVEKPTLEEWTVSAMVPVPVRSILAQAGLSVEEFRALL